MKKAALALLLTLGVSTSAYAWGEREQGILSGIAGIILLNKLNERPVVQQPPVVVQQPQVIQQHPHVIIEPQPPRRQYYSCLVRIYDTRIEAFRNEVMTCVK